LFLFPSPSAHTWRRWSCAAARARCLPHPRPADIPSPSPPAKNIKTYVKHIQTQAFVCLSSPHVGGQYSPFRLTGARQRDAGCDQKRKPVRIPERPTLVVAAAAPAPCKNGKPLRQPFETVVLNYRSVLTHPIDEASRIQADKRLHLHILFIIKQVPDFPFFIKPALSN
jgi:hypothetical protein